MLALVVHGSIDADNVTVPLWVKITGDVESQGFSAESSGAAVILGLVLPRLSSVDHAG